MTNTVKTDFSRLRIDKIDLCVDGVFKDNTLSQFMQEIAKDCAVQVDKAYLKSCLIKAKEYDTYFNPYTVTEHARHEEVQKFCRWMLCQIETDKLNKKGIVELLKQYEKE